jgi:hypothetical protein
LAPGTVSVHLGGAPLELLVGLALLTATSFALLARPVRAVGSFFNGHHETAVDER